MIYSTLALIKEEPLTPAPPSAEPARDDTNAFLDVVLSAVADAGFEPVVWYCHDNKGNIHRNRQVYPGMKDDTIKLVVDARTQDGSPVRIDGRPWRKTELENIDGKGDAAEHRKAPKTFLSPSFGHGEVDGGQLDEFDHVIVTTVVEALGAAGLEVENWAIGPIGERTVARFGGEWLDDTNREQRRIVLTLEPARFERASAGGLGGGGLPGLGGSDHVHPVDAPLVSYPELSPKAGKGPYRIRRTDPVAEGEKRCTSCEIDFPASTAHFDRNKDKPDGLDSWCKTCVSQRCKRYRQIKKGRQALADSIPADPDWRLVLFSTRDAAEAAYPMLDGAGYPTVTAGLELVPHIEEVNGMFGLMVHRRCPLSWLRSFAPRHGGVVVEN